MKKYETPIIVQYQLDLTDVVLASVGIFEDTFNDEGQDPVKIFD